MKPRALLSAILPVLIVILSLTTATTGLRADGIDGPQPSPTGVPQDEPHPTPNDNPDPIDENGEEDPTPAPTPGEIVGPVITEQMARDLYRQVLEVGEAANRAVGFWIGEKARQKPHAEQILERVQTIQMFMMENAGRPHMAPFLLKAAAFWNLAASVPTFDEAKYPGIEIVPELFQQDLVDAQAALNDGDYRRVYEILGPVAPPYKDDSNAGRIMNGELEEHVTEVATAFNEYLPAVLRALGELEVDMDTIQKLWGPGAE